MNLVIKVNMDNYDDWKTEFDNHEARSTVCDESKTTVGKIDDKSCIVMMYDVDMEGMQKLMSSQYLIELQSKMNIVNDEMHSFNPLPKP